MNELPNRDNLLTKEVAAFLKISLGTVYRLIIEKQLPCVNIGHVRRIPRDKFLEWYKANPSLLKPPIKKEFEKVFATKEDCFKSLLTRPQQTWSGEEFAALNKPIVYVWYRDDLILYVGRSLVGVSRLFSDHLQLKHAESDDRITAWFVESESEAVETEKALIFHLQPRFNIAHKHGKIA